jgi:CRP-like cAMP-binding protein
MENWFIASMPAETRAELEPHLEEVQLRRGEVLYTAGDPLDWVYFPQSGLIAIIITMLSGVTACSSLVGKNGMVNSVVVLDLSRALDQALVEFPGTALRLPTERFAAAYRGNEAFRIMVNSYHAMAWAEAQQSIACNALHEIEERLCRWLLEAHDRTGMDSLPITQELLSNLLGTQRTSVTLVQGKLASAGFIRTHRGVIDLLNIQGLQACSCECYRVLKDRIAEIFPTMPMPSTGGPQ